MLARTIFPTLTPMHCLRDLKTPASSFRQSNFSLYFWNYGYRNSRITYYLTFFWFDIRYLVTYPLIQVLRPVESLNRTSSKKICVAQFEELRFPFTHNHVDEYTTGWWSLKYLLSWRSYVINANVHCNSPNSWCLVRQLTESQCVALRKRWRESWAL